MSKKRYSFKKIGTKETRYDEFTGKPYKVDAVKLAEDQNGSLEITTILYPSIFTASVKHKK
jgi:hypothetical protein